MKKRKKTILPTNDTCSDSGYQTQFDSVKKNDYFLAEHDRITTVFGIKNNKIESVINVSYEIYIEKKWITVLRFDSAHGYLHRHTRISLDNPDTTVESVSVIKKGNPKDWLTWAIKYMNKNFYDCKVGFCKRSNINIIDLP